MDRNQASPESEPIEAASSSTFSFNLVQTAWKHKSLVLFGSLAGILLAVLYFVEKPAVYQTGASLIIKRNQVAPMMGGDRQFVFFDYISAHTDVLTSPMLAALAVEKFNLRELPSFQGVPNPESLIFTGITVTGNSATSIRVIPVVKLTYRGSNREDVRIILSAVIKAFKLYLNDKYKDSNKETRQNLELAQKRLTLELEKRVAERDELFKSDGELARFQDLVEPSNAVETRINDKGLRRTELQQQLEDINRMIKKGEDPSQILEFTPDDQKVESDLSREDRSSLRTALRNIKFQEDEAVARGLGPDHPELQRIKRQKEDLEERLLEAEKNAPRILKKKASPEEIKACLDALRRQIERLDRELEALKEIRKKEVEISRNRAAFQGRVKGIEDTIKRNQDNYTSNQVQLNGLDVVKNQDGYDVDELSAPGMGSKVEPRGTVILPMGLAFGLLAGVGLAYLAEWSDSSFRSPTEIRRRLGMNILGHVPAFNIEAEPAADMVGLDASLCTAHRGKSTEAEAFRGVRTSLFFAMQGAGHKVIQITSPSMGDGKSTLAANLAISIAQSGKSVLLIDADCRRPRQHRLFQLQTHVGLSSVLLGEAEPIDAIQITPVANLSVMPCGPKPPNPAELLTTQRFTDLLELMQARYDVVLVDTPPLLAVSDPCVVASRVDGVLLAIRLSKNGRPQAERAKEILASLNANVLGVVVNGLSRKGQDGYEGYNYGYGYGYNYSYGYGYGYGYEYTYQYAYDSGEYTQDADSETDINLDAEPSTNGEGHEVASNPSTGTTSRLSQRSHRSRKASKSKKKGFLNWLGKLWG